MVGVAGTVKAGLNVTVIVLAEASAPVDEVVKPTVQVAVEFAVWGEPENVTDVGDVGALTTSDTDPFPLSVVPPHTPPVFEL